MSTQTMYGLTGLLNSINLVKHDAHVHTRNHQLIKFYATESGVMSEMQYDELDEGYGLIELGLTYLVNFSQLPDELKVDDDYIADEIERFIYTNTDKPDWLI